MPKSLDAKVAKTLMTQHSPTKNTSAAILMLLTILDTTWRAFVPTIGGTFIGIGVDSMTHNTPIFTIIFIIAGFITSSVLIILQLRRVRQNR
jgi:F0F1-type ATP synthase assembly protein I